MGVDMAQPCLWRAMVCGERQTVQVGLACCYESTVAPPLLAMWPEEDLPAQGLSFFTCKMGLITAADPMKIHSNRSAWSGFPEEAAFKLRVRWESAPEGEWERRAISSEEAPSLQQFQGIERNSVFLKRVFGLGREKWAGASSVQPVTLNSH